jgi:hypothetical protein
MKASEQTQKKPQPNARDPEERRWRIEIGVETTISLAALLVSIASLAFTLIYNLAPGEVYPLKPAGYAIIRGVSVFPSDHLVLPMEWENSSGKPIVIRHPYLVLRELDPAGKETGTEYRFLLAGEYPEISSKSFLENHSIKRSFTLEPHSLSVKILLFHRDRWWDENSSQYSFQFPADTAFRVYIGFQRNLEDQPETLLCEIITYKGPDILEYRSEGSYWWDFWSIE